MLYQPMSFYLELCNGRQKNKILTLCLYLKFFCENSISQKIDTGTSGKKNLVVDTKNFSRETTWFSICNTIMST